MPAGPRLLVALALLSGTSRADDPPPPGPLRPPAAGEFVVVPLRVHVLTSGEIPEVDCALTDADVRRVLGKVNGIWHQAGVHFGLDAIVREPAALQGRFKAAREAGPADGLGPFRLLAPKATRLGDGVDVYYIHKFPVNGVFLGDRMAFVQETAKLRPVPGGIDEPLPRVTAHELGHALGLPHRQDRTNLLASGTTGTTLNQAEVDKARDRARKVPGALAAPDLRKKLDEAAARKDDAEARRLRGWLDELAGVGAEAIKVEAPQAGGPSAP